mmetsp:Transcript_3394/g.5309  ORF Transcript_3394/g.5309 Transcript_3394/m.5309 type:complete len:261 (+) Transcript_3394:148-930(+)
MYDEFGSDEHDNFDVERNELIRLMGTAKDDYRKAIIRDSLSSLDSPDRKYTRKKYGTHNVAAAHSTIYEPEKLQCNFSKSPIRPISARLRRPSMNNLDVIQEEKRISMEKSIDLKDHSVSYIQLDDVYEFSSSSFDPGLPFWNPFSLSNHSNSRWVSTGMMPQFISIDLKLCWLIVDIRVTGFGIEKMSLSVEGSANRVPMKKDNSTTFSFVSSSVMNSAEESSCPSKIFGDRVLFTFEEATDIFFAVETIRIRAVPTGA